MNYAPYTWKDGAAGGTPLTADRMNLLEKAVGNAAVQSNWPVNILDFGAKCDGTTDDTAAVQAALDTGRPVYVPLPTSVSNLVNNQGNAIFGDGWGNSRLIARPGTSTIYTAKQKAGLRISNIWFDCNNNAATAIDTSWTIPSGGAAPSLRNRYDYVRVSKYTGVGWIAVSNNDSPFENILIEASNNNIALNLQAYGGAVVLQNSSIYGPIQLGCQQANITGCVMRGIRITGSDYNLINGTGGYWYADASRGANIWIENGVNITSPPVLTGVHLENAYSGGGIIGGTGAIEGTTVFTGCHIFTTNNASNVTLVQSSVDVLNFQNAMMLLTGCFIENVSTSALDNPKIGVSLANSSNQGLMRGPGRRSMTLAQGASGTLTQVPRSGLLQVRIASGAGNWTVVAYGRNASSTGTVTTLASDGAGLLTVTIPSTNACDVECTDVTISHGVTATVTLEINVLGF